MVTTLTLERAPALTWGSRTVYFGAILGALSAFALGSATHTPHFEVVHAATRPADTAVPAPAAVVKAPTLKLVKPLKQLAHGMASWYGKVLQDHRTASGRRFDMLEMTAAHRNLPFGSLVRVTDLRNRRSVVVTITDRGILSEDRIIDLSYAAAAELDMIKSGVDPVKLEVLPPVFTAKATPPPQPE